MTVRAAGLGSPRNGLDFTARPYVYRGTGADTLTAEPDRRRSLRRESLSSRIVTALGDLGGEASTLAVRRALEDSGGAPRNHLDVGVTLWRLARMAPPRVTAVGEGQGGAGKAQRWRLADARAAAAPVAPVAAAQPVRCGGCGYLTSARGHKDTCGEPGSLSALLAGNARRTAEAGVRDAEVLAALLASGRPLPERHRRIAEARVASPQLPWAELAASLGMNKDQARACYRRMMRRTVPQDGGET